MTSSIANCADCGQYNTDIESLPSASPPPADSDTAETVGPITTPNAAAQAAASDTPETAGSITSPMAAPADAADVVGPLTPPDADADMAGPMTVPPALPEPTADSNDWQLQATVPDRHGRRVITVQCGGQQYEHQFHTLNADQRRRFARQCTEALSLPENVADAIAQQISAAAQLVDATQAAEQNQPISAAGPIDPLAAFSPIVVENAHWLLRQPDFFNLLNDHFDQLGIVGETGLASAIYLCGTSRLLPKPVSAIIQAASAVRQIARDSYSAAAFPTVGADSCNRHDGELTVLYAPRWA